MSRRRAARYSFAGAAVVYRRYALAEDWGSLPAGQSSCSRRGRWPCNYGSESPGVRDPVAPARRRRTALSYGRYTRATGDHRTRPPDFSCET